MSKQRINISNIGKLGKLENLKTLIFHKKR